MQVVKTARYTESTIDEHSAVAAVTVKKIRVVGFVAYTKEAVAFTFQSAEGVSATSLFGPIETSDKQFIVVNPEQGYLFETVAGEALFINQETAKVLELIINYVEV